MAVERYSHKDLKHVEVGRESDLSPSEEAAKIRKIWAKQNTLINVWNMAVVAGKKVPKVVRDFVERLGI